jgi:hypothetical protein
MQALAYKVGEIKLWEIRRNVESQLGEKFDIKVRLTDKVPIGISYSVYSQCRHIFIQLLNIITVLFSCNVKSLFYYCWAF